MKTAPVNTAKPAASPATTGTQAPRLAQNNAHRFPMLTAAPVEAMEPKQKITAAAAPIQFVIVPHITSIMKIIVL